MEAITLNEEQKNKLLEMTKALFPEYTYFYITYQNGNSDATDEAQRWVNCTDREGKEITIHWFEFCSTYLLLAILKPKEHSRYHRETIEGFSCNTTAFIRYNKGQHPVDYLYEEFKRLHNTWICDGGSYAHEVCIYKGKRVAKCDGGCMYPG